MRFAIGDIHGCNLTFREMVTQILALNPRDTLFLLGDYIDRGPDSKGVIDFILELQKQSFDIRPVMGNHEYMLVNSWDYEGYSGMWEMNGSLATLRSYGMNTEEAREPGAVRRIPIRHLEFFRSLPLFQATDDFLFVHAGISTNHPDPLNDPDTLLWTRSEEFPEDLLTGKKLIHGHSPVSAETIKSRLLDPESRVINLDGGCVYNHFPGAGKLVAMNLDTFELYTCDNKG